MKKNILKYISILVGLVAFISILLFVDIDPEKPAITATLAVAVLMAILWITEAIPVAVTSLIPVVLFPLLGIMDGKKISGAYINHVIFLFIGGFLMALAMEKHNLHKRIALKVLSVTGSGYGKILFGFMFSTAFLSMWMSNTATAMMMVPVAISIISKFEDILNETQVRKYSSGILFGIAYSASIGGIATLIGTPPNLSFIRIFSILFPAAPEISFSQWFIFALPVSIIMLVFAWILLYLKFKTKNVEIQQNYFFANQYKALGKISYEEIIVLIFFILLAFLWITRSGITIENFEIKGWASLFNNPKFINDGTVAIAISGILFLIPQKKEKGKRILESASIYRLPWNIILLFGGGYALAQGFADSGLALWMGEQMKVIAAVPSFFIILIIALFMSFLTELTSNTATTEMILPIMAGLGVSTGINPLLLMIPATMAASLAFMLPIATPPNAIVFGTNRLKISEMIKTGFLLNIIGVLIITIVMYYWGQKVLGIDLSIIPEWIK